MKIPFSPDQILERMQFENPWWNSGGIEEYYSQLTRRAYYLRLFSLMQDRSVQRAVVLMGPRRVGKTVLLFHCIQGLIEQGINPQKICYISVETPIYNGISLEELLQFYLTASGHSADSELFLIFDEIQYLKNWELHLKSLVDSYKKIKFIVSGSAAAALKLKSTESGAGRFTDFVLPPLTFQEYLQLKKIDISITEDTDRSSGYEEQLFYTTNDIKRLNQHFIDYINFGGYPEVSLSTTIQSDPGRYIRNDIIDKVLLRDLPLLYGIADIQEFNSLVTYIAYNTGCEMSLESIASSSGVSKNTIKKYISYLEAAFLITIVNRVDQTGKKFKRANFFKIYLTNPSLRCALFSPIKDGDPLMGNLVETAIFSQWQHSIYPLYYARWQNGEVDIVYLDNEQKPKWIVEIKWSNKSISDHNQLRNLIHFGHLHAMKSATITTIDTSARNEISGLLFDFIPSSLYCYTVGKNLILYKNPLGKSITPV